MLNANLTYLLNTCGWLKTVSKLNFGGRSSINPQVRLRLGLVRISLGSVRVKFS